VCCLKSNELWFVNIFCAKTFFILCPVDILCLLRCITGTTEVTEGCSYFSRGSHVDQPRFKACSTMFQIQKFYILPTECMYVFFMGQTAIISLYSIKLLIFVPFIWSLDYHLGAFFVVVVVVVVLLTLIPLCMWVRGSAGYSVQWRTKLNSENVTWSGCWDGRHWYCAWSYVSKFNALRRSCH